MHGAACVFAMAMQPAMQAPSGGIWRIGAFHTRRIIGIDNDQIRGFDARKVHLIGVHQEFGSLGVNGQAKVIGHRLMHVQSHRPAKGGGEIDTLLPIVHIGARIGCCHRIVLYRCGWKTCRLMR